MGASESNSLSTGKSSSFGGTGDTSSLSFLPALLGDAFFGTGIRLQDGAFQLGGPGDSRTKKQIKRDTKLGREGPVSLSGAGGTLDTNSLLSNLLDLTNPDINPSIAGVLEGLQAGETGAGLANQLLGQDILPTFQEGLETGFKPDLQPIIDEAQRGFFQDIVPQLGQQNVALQEGVGPFSTDLSGQLLQAGGDLQSQLGSLETGLQERAGDRRGDLLSLSNLFTDQLFNANTDAARNRLGLGEELAQFGTTGGRQAGFLQFLNSLISGQPIQSSSQFSKSKNLSLGQSGGVGLSG